MQIHEQLSKLKQSVGVLDAFISEYGDQLPDGLGTIDLGFGVDPVPRYGIYLTSKVERDRLRALQVLGDVFGRNDWTSKPSYDSRSFDWKKVLSGVEISIAGAETLPPLQSMPVPASKFPIQLEDAK